MRRPARTKPRLLHENATTISSSAALAADVLLRRARRPRPTAGGQGRAARTSRISDAEMARINIETSAARAEWIDLYRRERGGGLYGRLCSVRSAIYPMPQRTSKPRLGPLSPLTSQSRICILRLRPRGRRSLQWADLTGFHADPHQRVAAVGADRTPAGPHWVGAGFSKPLEQRPGVCGPNSKVSTGPRQMEFRIEEIPRDSCLSCPQNWCSHNPRRSSSTVTAPGAGQAASVVPIGLKASHLEREPPVGVDARETARDVVGPVADRVARDGGGEEILGGLDASERGGQEHCDSDRVDQHPHEHPPVRQGLPSLSSSVRAPPRPDGGPRPSGGVTPCRSRRRS